MSKAHRVEVFKGKNGDWWWRRKAANNRIVSNSAEGYRNKAHAVMMACKLNAGKCELKIIT